MSRDLRIDTLRLQLPAALQARSTAIVQALTQGLAALDAAGQLPDPLPEWLDRLALPPLGVPPHASDAQIGQALADRLGQALGVSVNGPWRPGPAATRTPGSRPGESDGQSAVAAPQPRKGAGR